jgi:hypothetical protein
LYALKYAPLLSTKWDTTDVLQALEKGFDNWDTMAVMEAKTINQRQKSGKRGQQMT